jgi:NAD-dependent dihydropyrimidine dehydrogenase PreA subunit
MVKIEVDLKKCDGDGICVSICPVEVFELKKLPEYSDNEKSVPVNKDECILCMACVTSCPQEAITVEED